MLFSWLSKFLASLLVSVLATLVITTVFNQTILNSHYIEGQLTKTNSYSRLSTALVSEVNTQSNAVGDPAVATKLQSILTPAVLQQKINGSLDQLQAYYRGNGPEPVINLTDLASQAQSAGVNVSATAALNQPIRLTGNAHVRNASTVFNQVRVTTLVSSVLLAVALLAISWERHRYAALPDVLISVGVLLGIMTVSLWLASDVIGHHITLSTGSSAFALIGRDLITSITTDLARRFGIIAALFLGIGIGVRIWLRYLRTRKPTVPAITDTALEPATRI